MENPNPQSTKWYDKTWFVVLLCILFFPVGLYALWKSNNIGKGWKIVVTAIIALFVVASFGDDPKTTESSNLTSSNQVAEESIPPKPQLTQAEKDSIEHVKHLALLEERRNQTISAADLVQNYINNEVRADENFKGKSFYVEGTVTNIKKDILGDIFVTLEGADMIREVQCYFDDKSTATQLEKGMRVTFYGECDGLMMHVLMKNCKLVENLSQLEREGN